MNPLKPSSSLSPLPTSSSNTLNRNLPSSSSSNRRLDKEKGTLLPPPPFGFEPWYPCCGFRSRQDSGGAPQEWLKTTTDKSPKDNNTELTRKYSAAFISPLMEKKFLDVVFFALKHFFKGRLLFESIFSLAHLCRRLQRRRPLHQGGGLRQDRLQRERGRGRRSGRRHPSCSSSTFTCRHGWRNTTEDRGPASQPFFF